MQTNVVAILDDEKDRLDAMLAHLHKRYPRLEVATFLNAPEMIAGLRHLWDRLALICLDHDLGPCIQQHGRIFDPGTGRDVANCLATNSPVCPIIVHTTNTYARPGMLEVLTEAKWQVSYVSPYADVLWIREVWADEVSRVLDE